MNTIFNSKVFKGVSIEGKIVKGMVKNGVVFWQTLPTDHILAYDFNGNTTDSSVNGLNGAMTGTLAFDTGRKIGTQSMKFTNGCVKTILPLPVNSDKVSISFWMKTVATTGNIAELSTDYNSNNAFRSGVNGKITFTTHSPSGYNGGNSSSSINTNVWTHVVLSVDRSLGINQVKIYVNGALGYIQSPSTVDNITGNFVNNILFIGQRGASSLPFVGNLQDLKIYNRVLSEEEITALYNE